MSLDQNIAWENVKKVRNDFIKSYNESSSCKYLLSFKDIKHNTQLFMNLSNATNLQKNLTKEAINRGAKIFLYLNSCPKTKTKKRYLTIFKQIFKTSKFESTNSGIILFTLNVMKLFPNDGRKIASKILEKISTLIKLPLIQTQKHNLTLNLRNMNPKSSNHPVHILDREGNIAPSSFIPFCSFGNDMKNMGRQMIGFNNPVCNSFEARIRNDQLCYEVNLEKYKDKNNIQEQLESGLVLLLDYNLERQSEMYNPENDEDENDVHIYLNTISKLHFRNNK